MVALCETVLVGKGSESIDRQGFLAQADKMASAGLRVLAVAYRNWPVLPPDPSPEEVEVGLTFLGLVGLMDPPREEAAEAVRIVITSYSIHYTKLYESTERLGALHHTKGETPCIVWPTLML